MVVVRGWGKEKWKLPSKGHEISFIQGEKGLENCHTTFCLSNIVLYTKTFKMSDLMLYSYYN
jgi:hypothetical protein